MSSRALVSGMISARPNQGGATWAVLQFVLGLRRLGWDVHFVETLDRSTATPAGTPLERSQNVAYLASTMSAFGLEGSWTVLDRDRGDVVGMSRHQLIRFSAGADLLLNISGALKDEALVEKPALRVYVDLDPAFTQLWHGALGIDMGFDRHDRFVTVGQAIGMPGCDIPTCGRDWIGILPPVVLEHWAAGGGPSGSDMTTVGNWRGYGSIEHGGFHYGQRAHTMRRLITLPRLVGQRFLVALAIHPDETDDIQALDANGWRRIDPSSVAYDTFSYRRFVRESMAELAVPKGGYVTSRSGWFSDRSACYLASGRPVIMVATGFERFLPVGQGLLPFDGVDEAAECVAAVTRDYAVHSAAARRIAEECLDSDVVLPAMLDALAAKAAVPC